jgi:hypothetical protein
VTTSKILDSQLVSAEIFDDATVSGINYYADGIDGSDSNDGLTINTPKLTLQAVFDLVPFHVKNDVVITLSGTFIDDTAVLNNYIYGGAHLVIDGGEGVTRVSGPYTVSAGDATYVGTASSVEEWSYAGYWVKLTGGTQSDFIRGCVTNKLDTSYRFYFSKDLPSSVSVDDTFIICKPTTKLTSSSSIKIACFGDGSVVAQRIHLDVSSKIWSERARSTVVLTALTADDSLIGPAYDFKNCSEVRFGSSLYSGGSFSDDTISAGVSVVGGASGASMVELTNVDDVNVSGGSLSKVLFNSCGIGLINDGAYFTKGINIINSTSISGYVDEPYSFELSSGYYTVLPLHNAYYGDWANGTDGIYILNSNIGIKELTSSYSSSHGIELENSTLRVVISGTLSGSSNTGAGVYAHSGSRMLIHTDSTTVTITGTVGHLSVDGTTEDSTWTAITGGTPAVDTGEMVIVENYTQ